MSNKKLLIIIPGSQFKIPFIFKKNLQTIQIPRCRTWTR